MFFLADNFNTVLKYWRDIEGEKVRRVLAINLLGGDTFRGILIDKRKYPIIPLYCIVRVTALCVLVYQNSLNCNDVGLFFYVFCLSSTHSTSRRALGT